MNRTVHYLVAIALLMALAVPLQVWRDRGWRAYEPATPILWLRAGPAIKRLSLGFDALLADLYWIRTVVYFGRQRLSTTPNKNYDLLFPLLELVTRLDPRFTIAYRFGAIFLSEPPPNGPGRPDLAVSLLQRGVEVSPERWEYLHAIGFVYYWSHRDFAAAADWIERASRIEGAPIWLKSTAALMRQEAGDRQSARILWRQLADSADDESLKNLANTRLLQFSAMDEIDALNGTMRRFEARAGRRARSWQELIDAQLVRRVPLDPVGMPYMLDHVHHLVRLAERSSLWPLPEGFPSSVP